MSCEARNVSVGGMFLATTATTPALLSELQITLSLPGSQRSATLGARVLHVLSAQRARNLGLTPGIGVQLERFDQRGLDLMHELVAWARERDPRPRIARMRAGADRAAIRHEPMLGFLLGYIDGKRDPEALAQELALDVDTIERMLSELSKHGVVELVAANSGGSAAPPTAADPSSLRASQQPLPNALQEELSTLEARLPTADYYELLGVGPDTSPEQARSAFVARNSELHASIRPPAEAQRIERVLGRLRDACDVLSHTEQKDEYDQYMERAEWLKAAEVMRARLTAAPPAPDAPVDSQPAALKHAARLRASRAPASERNESPQPTAASLRAPRVPSIAPAEPAARSSAELPATRKHSLPPRAASQSVQPRTRAQSADLPAPRTRSIAPTAASTKPSQAPATPGTTDLPATKTLSAAAGVAQPSQPSAAPNTARLHAARARVASMRPAATSKKDAPSAAAQILAQAEAAFAAGQTSAASRHLTLLSAMTFDDPQVKARLDEIKLKVLRAAAVDAEKQAAYEEKHQRWALAAQSWLRVAKGRPNDSYPLQRAACAQLQAGVEPRLAMETAKRALEISPNDAQAHRTLAKVYMAADMQASARRELELAQRCGQNDAAHDDQDPKTTGLLQRLLGRDED